MFLCAEELRSFYKIVFEEKPKRTFFCRCIFLFQLIGNNLSGNNSAPISISSNGYDSGNILVVVTSFLLPIRTISSDLYNSTKTFEMTTPNIMFISIRLRLL